MIWASFKAIKTERETAIVSGWIFHKEQEPTLDAVLLGIPNRFESLNEDAREDVSEGIGVPESLEYSESVEASGESENIIQYEMTISTGTRRVILKVTNFVASIYHDPKDATNSAYVRKPFWECIFEKPKAL